MTTKSNEETVAVSIEEDKKESSNNPSANNNTSAKKQNPEEKRVRNKDFQDVRDTGRWGSSISKTEKIVIAVIFFVVIVGVAVALGVILNRDDSDKSSAPSAAPSYSPTNPVPYKAKVIREAGIFQEFPEDLETLRGSISDPEASPQDKAMEYSLFLDETDPASDMFLQRYALVVLYYSMGGDGALVDNINGREGNEDSKGWLNATNWPFGADACQFYGVTCSNAFTDRIRAIKLESNNLVGTLPDEILGLKYLLRLDLRENRLGGTLPALSLSQHPTLTDVFLFQNEFTGTLSDSLGAGQALDRLEVWGNNLTGTISEDFCNPNITTLSVLYADCKLDCPCYRTICRECHGDF